MVGWLDSWPPSFEELFFSPIGSPGGDDDEGVARRLEAAIYSTRKLSFSWSYRISFALAPVKRVTIGGPPHLIANSPIPARVLIICMGMEVLFVHPLGSDCSRRVRDVVVGERASIDHPCRSTCVRITLGSTAGMLGKICGSSAEKANTCIVVGDL
jgi:hypothetical protein